MRNQTAERTIEVLNEHFCGDVANMARALRNPDSFDRGTDIRDAIDDVLLYDTPNNLIAILQAYYQNEAKKLIFG
jgi:hypothetical protein